MKFSKRVLEVIGVPSDLGANITGANMGPSEMRNAKLHDKLLSLPLSLIDEGDVEVPLRHTLEENEHRDKFLKTISKVCSQVALRVHRAMSLGRTPLTVGGDHSTAIGSISGVSQWYREHKKKLALVWIDAHTDINTPEISPSGNVHGMPLAVILGQGFQELTAIGFHGAKVSPERTAVVGVRSVDEKEKEMCRKMGIRIYTMREIDERGMKAVMDEVIENVVKASDGVHVSFDMDSVDPQHAPGVSTPVAGGLNYREAHLAMEMLSDTQMVSSVDIMELNPILDRNQMTANLAVELLQSLFGKKIL